MNREEKLLFIEENHPELYRLLESNVSEFLEDVWHADINSINLYNSWVSFYCGQQNDISLMKKLLI